MDLVSTVYQRQVDNTRGDCYEQEIWNINPIQHSGYNTPKEPGYFWGDCLQPETKKYCYPEVSLEYKVAVEMCRKKLLEFLSVNDHAALQVFSGWMAKFMFSPFESENLKRKIRHANDLVEPFKEQFPIISKADLFVLATCVSVKLLGVADIVFHPGRKDKDEPSKLKEDSLSYDPTVKVFPETRQLSSKEFLILHGSFHYRLDFYEENFGPERFRTSNSRFDIYDELYGIEEEGSGIEILGIGSPRIDNSYYKELLKRREGGQFLSPMDKIFLEDPVLHSLVEKYAADQDAFLADFAQAFMKLSELEFADA